MLAEAASGGACVRRLTVQAPFHLFQVRLGNQFSDGADPAETCDLRLSLVVTNITLQPGMKHNSSPLGVPRANLHVTTMDPHISEDSRDHTLVGSH